MSDVDPGGCDATIMELGVRDNAVTSKHREVSTWQISILIAVAGGVIT